MSDHAPGARKATNPPRWHAALLYLLSSSRHEVSRIENITRVIYVDQALLRRCRCQFPGGGGAEGRPGTAHASFVDADTELPALRAGLVPAIHVFLAALVLRRGCPGIADKFTQSAQRRLLWPGMTTLAKRAIGCISSQTLQLNPRHHRRRCRRQPDQPHDAAYGSDRPTTFDTRHWRRAASRASRARSPCRLI